MFSLGEIFVLNRFVTGDRTVTKLIVDYVITIQSSTGQSIALDNKIFTDNHRAMSTVKYRTTIDKISGGL